jgi:hypothetical protein
MRRGLITLALAVPMSVSVLVGDSAAWAGVQHPAGQCTAHHLSGCDGTDSPTWNGKHGRKLMYCGPDGTCGPVDAAAAKRDTELYGDPRSR